MSSKGSRKSYAAPTEDKEKKPAESPVKDMKKKVAANAEKEKHTDKTVKSLERSEKSTEKHDKVEKTPHEKVDSKKVDKHVAPEKTTQADKAAKHVGKNERKSTDKSPEKNDKSEEKNDKGAEKHDKSAEKHDKSAEKHDKSAEKHDKGAEKHDKSVEKSDKNAENKKVNDKKADKPAEKKNELEKEAPKVDINGKDALEKSKTATTNGNSNGTDTVSDEASSDEEELLIIDSQDEIFPELTYDESDVEVDDAPSRSFTRRSQVKATKTPETPRPASFKDDDSKEKLLKMKDPLATDRKLRSADALRSETKEKEDPQDLAIDLTEEEKEGQEKEKEVQVVPSKNKLELEVPFKADGLEGDGRPRARARVSPYTRPKLDQTSTSLVANYTGNNTTMEMDITETSSTLEDASLESSGYLHGLRNIRGRSSYKQLKELNLSHKNTSLNTSGRSNQTYTHSRKRKPSAEPSPAPPTPPTPSAPPAPEHPELTESTLHAHSKRMRLPNFSVPFRGFNTRRADETCGINSDLPLTAPVAPGPSDAPEAPQPGPAPWGRLPVLLTPPVEKEPKRSCVIV